MDEVYIDIRKENEWIQKYFTTDFVSIETLIGVIQDLDDEVDLWKNKYKDLEEEYRNQEEDSIDAYDWWRDSHYDRE